MRVANLFKRILGLDALTVDAVAVTDDGIVIDVRVQGRPRCPCGALAGRYDGSIRRWRHLDIAGRRVWLQARVARVWCRSCRKVRTQDVGFARPGARHTTVFEDTVAWCAQRMDKTAASKLLRVSWTTVDRIIARVVTQASKGRAIGEVRRIGVDEISYRKRHRYLTVVVDHDNGGRVIWVGEGRKADTFGAFFDELGQEATAQIEAISMDLSPAYLSAAGRYAPGATVCLDPFHVIGLANRSIDDLRRRYMRMRPGSRGRQGREVRWALLKDPSSLSASEQSILDELSESRSELFQAWTLKEELRGLYALDEPASAAAYFDRWCDRATRSGITVMAKLANTLRFYRAGIIAAVELGLSNSRLEGMNSKIRLLNHRGYGHHSAAALAAMIYLACGGLAVALPLR